MNDRIGTLEKLPKLTITGKTYSLPCSTLSLGNGQYAVLDTFGNTPNEIEALMSSLKTPRKKTKASEGKE